MALALIVTAVLVGLAALLALQWTGLRDCQETCSCEVFGRSVRVPDNPLCGPDRIDPARIELGLAELSRVSPGADPGSDSGT